MSRTASRSIGVALVLVVGAGFTAACGSDTGRGGGTDAGTTDTGGGDAGLTNQCTSTEDQAALDRIYEVDDAGVGKDISEISKACALSCITAPDQELCMRQCLDDRSDVSDQCATCLLLSVACSQENCLGPCLTGGDDACLACRCGGNDAGVNCLTVFENCAGITSTQCD